MQVEKQLGPPAQCLSWLDIVSAADGEVMENSGRVLHDFHSLDVNMEEDEHEQEAEQVHRQQVS